MGQLLEKCLCVAEKGWDLVENGGICLSSEPSIPCGIRKGSRIYGHC